jgi:hypothetical protein
VTEGELEMSGGLILKGSTIAIGNVRQAQLFIACPFLLPCVVWSVITEVLVCGAVLSFLLCKSQFMSFLQGFVDLRTLLSEAMGPNAQFRLYEAPPLGLTLYSALTLTNGVSSMLRDAPLQLDSALKLD